MVGGEDHAHVGMGHPAHVHHVCRVSRRPVGMEWWSSPCHKPTRPLKSMYSAIRELLSRYPLFALAHEVGRENMHSDALYTKVHSKRYGNREVSEIVRATSILGLGVSKFSGVSLQAHVGQRNGNRIHCNSKCTVVHLLVKIILGIGPLIIR